MNQKITNSYASPPCFDCTQLQPGTGEPGFDAAQWRDVARWRKAERERLIAARLAISADERARMTINIVAEIDALVGDPRDQIDQPLLAVPRRT